MTDEHLDKIAATVFDFSDRAVLLPRNNFVALFAEIQRLRELVLKLDTGVNRVVVALGWPQGGTDFNGMVNSIEQVSRQNAELKDLAAKLKIELQMQNTNAER